MSLVCINGITLNYAQTVSLVQYFAGEKQSSCRITWEETTRSFPSVAHNSVSDFLNSFPTSFSKFFDALTDDLEKLGFVCYYSFEEMKMVLGTIVQKYPDWKKNRHATIKQPLETIQNSNKLYLSQLLTKVEGEAYSHAIMDTYGLQVLG
ncbi:MAG: hypothetical protein ACYCQJ_13345 [Nitrososphaerales archaeon]